ncbi:MAG: hypothetical protein UU29_C0012G0040 [Candidatus Daviesbacteria bacterium GW2011_GWA2_40_9]|uniref:Uncharacterized protein n=1 Tax=Candidatus Daviesbacteria bacterium GW2011_GWA2_40_9 TaxID=1618424 RepID=A0A0G0X4G6_9BACT|nr:MAG: hypothetical protein UU26_C0025G0006 [Candidatus Daviesbacteria bacterium GW2011_GWC1_40_9]KKR82502.1 MAG: hypothetical protein UU29_C0012G0040 [Candidatus Daviesbacteria bacterium GW2011_GWA2_40_9]
MANQPLKENVQFVALRCLELVVNFVASKVVRFNRDFTICKNPVLKVQGFCGKF